MNVKQLAVILFSIFFSQIAFSQRAAQIDARPLERSKAMISIKTSDPRDLLVKIGSVLSDNGFQVLLMDVNTGDIDATRADRIGTGNYDRIVIWLERDFTSPGDWVKLFLNYGRYEIVLGKGNKAQRIIIDEQKASARIVTVTKAIMDLATIR